MKDDELTCNNCGEKLLETDKFCPHCGKRRGMEQNKIVLVAIMLIAIILVGGFVANNVYKSMVFDENLKEAVYNRELTLFFIDEGWDEIENSRYGAGYPVAKGNFQAAESFNINESRNLKKCKDFAQSEEEKKLIQILMDENALYNELIGLNIRGADLLFNFYLDRVGTYRESDIAEAKNIDSRTKEIEKEINDKELEKKELLKKHPNLRKKLADMLNEFYSEKS